MATVPNQKIIKIHREKCERDFLQIKKENWFAANKNLEAYGLLLYLYLAGNKDGFNLELSQEAAEREAGIKKTSFHKYVKKLIEKGYLVQRKEGSNIYDFYEVPQEKKITEAATSYEQTSSQGEHTTENKDYTGELLGLLCESDSSQDGKGSSKRNKEIYNIQINNINKKDTFVF